MSVSRRETGSGRRQNDHHCFHLNPSACRQAHRHRQLWSSTSARSEAACSICKRIPSQLNAIADKWEKERTEIHQANTQENRNLLRHQVTAILFLFYYSISLWPQTALAVEDLLHTTCTWIVFVQWGMACQAPSDKWQKRGKWERPAEAASWDGFLVY